MSTYILSPNTLRNYIAYGVDVANTFAEAPLTVTLLYVTKRPSMQGVTEEQRTTPYPSGIRTPSSTCTTWAPREPTTLGQDNQRDTQIQYVSINYL